MQRDLGISIKHSTPEEAFQIVVQRGKMGRTVAREPSPVDWLTNGLEARHSTGVISPQRAVGTPLPAT